MTTVALHFPSENVERRVLAHLPVYRTQKDHKVAERLETKGDEKLKIAGQNMAPYVDSFTIDEMVVRLSQDDDLPTDLAQRAINGGLVPQLMDTLLVAKERSADLDEFWTEVVRILRESGLIAVNAEFVANELNGLRERGYAETFPEDQDLPAPQRRWRMTKAGLEALTAEQEGV